MRSYIPCKHGPGFHLIQLHRLVSGQSIRKKTTTILRSATGCSMAIGRTQSNTKKVSLRVQNSSMTCWDIRIPAYLLQPLGFHWSMLSFRTLQIQTANPKMTTHHRSCPLGPFHAGPLWWECMNSFFKKSSISPVGSKEKRHHSYFQGQETYYWLSRLLKKRAPILLPKQKRLI